MYRRKDAWLWGIKFLDFKGKTLLATGLIDRNSYKTDRESWPVKVIKLKEGERIIGVKANQVTESAHFYGV